MNTDNYKALPELLPDEIIERASKLNSALLCDGMKELGVLRNGAMDASMMPVDSSMKVVGTACTVSTEEGNNLPIHVAVYMSKPGYVMVIDGQGYEERAYIGDLLVGAGKAVGLKGMILDGMARDKVGLKELGLPVFSKGFMQRSPAKYGPGKINTPISCGGVNVNPGDLVFGDYDGVTVVPKEHIEEVLKNAETKLGYESKREEVIKEYEEARKSGKDLPKLSPDWVDNILKDKK